MDLRRVINMVRAWLPLLVAAVVVAAGGAFVLSNAQAKVFEARATLIVGQSLSSTNPDYSQLLVSQRLSTTYAAVASTRPLLEKVIAKLRLDATADNLATRVRADSPPDSTLMTVTAQDADPATAAAIANAVAEQLIEASPAIQGRETEFQATIDADLEATRAEITATQAQVQSLSSLSERTPEQAAQLQALEDRLASLRSTYATLLSFASGTSASLLTVIEPAVASAVPISPRVLLNTLAGAVLGLLLALGIAFLAEYLDDSVKDPDGVQEVTGLSTLGSITRMDGDRSRQEVYRLAPLLYPRSSTAEAYRTTRTNIEFASIDAPIHSLLVTSARPVEGKTITACNVAIVFAQAGRRVLLVDADLRRPGVHIAFKLENRRGLTTLLRDDGETVEAVAQQTEVPDLLILTSGPLPPNPTELMASQRMRTILERLTSSADLVILDSPPLQAASDSAILSSLADATLLIIDARRSHRRAVRLARESLAKAGANVVGVVLNRIPVGQADEVAYAGYYADAKAAAGEPEPSTPPAPQPQSTGQT